MNYKDIIKKCLYKYDEIIFVYLYGSLAIDKEHRNSDIDIAIYINKYKKPKASIFGYKSDLIVELQSQFSRDIDLVILNDISISLAFNILKTGKLLFTKSNYKRIKFHYIVMSKYLDFLPFYKAQNQYIKENIEKNIMDVETLVNEKIILNKLNQLDNYINKLRSFEDVDRKELENDLDKLWAIERGLQLSIQKTLDIGNHILIEEGITIEKYDDIFKELIKLKILPEKFSKKYKGLADLRNILAHQNTEVDIEILIKLINNDLDYFKIFSRYINGYLNKKQ